MTTAPVKNKAEILSFLGRESARLRTFGVKRIGLFGSFVDNKQNELSDIYILVEFEQGLKSFDNFMNLLFFLEDALGRPVDLITLESLSPYLGPHILKETEYVPLAA